MPEHPGAQSAEEVGGDGHIRQAPLSHPVHHAHVGAEEAGVADADIASPPVRSVRDKGVWS